MDSIPLAVQPASQNGIVAGPVNKALAGISGRDPRPDSRGSAGLYEPRDVLPSLSCFFTKSESGRRILGMSARLRNPGADCLSQWDSMRFFRSELVRRGRPVHHQPVVSYRINGLSELSRIHWLLDIAINSESVSLDNIPLFRGRR